MIFNFFNIFAASLKQHKKNLYFYLMEFSIYIQFVDIHSIVADNNEFQCDMQWMQNFYFYPKMLKSQKFLVMWKFSGNIWNWWWVKFDILQPTQLRTSQLYIISHLILNYKTYSTWNNPTKSSLKFSGSVWIDLNFSLVERRMA